MSASHDTPPRPPWSVIWALSVTQIISWGSLFYAISLLIAPIEHQFGWSRDAIVGAFSLSMVCSGLAAYPVGVMIDRYGGRFVMGGGSVMAAVMLALLSQTNSLPRSCRIGTRTAGQNGLMNSQRNPRPIVLYQ